MKMSQMWRALAIRILEYSDQYKQRITDMENKISEMRKKINNMRQQISSLQIYTDGVNLMECDGGCGAWELLNGSPHWYAGRVRIFYCQQDQCEAKMCETCARKEGWDSEYLLFCTDHKNLH